MSGVSTAIQLAKKMGKSLDSGKILLQILCSKEINDVLIVAT
jgi:hypothetical protein